MIRLWSVGVREQACHQSAQNRMRNAFDSAPQVPSLDPFDNLFGGMTSNRNEATTAQGAEPGESMAALEF